MKKKILNLLDKFLPNSLYIFILKINIFFNKIDLYFKSLPNMTKIFGSKVSLIFFPLTGRISTKGKEINIPRKYWDTLPWISEIYTYGAELRWSGSDLYSEYNNVIFCSSAQDESHRTVFLEANFVDEYDIKDMTFKDKNILDVGSNIGDTAIFFANKGAKKVYSFEPLPSVYEYLNKTIRANKFDEVIETHCVGLSDKEEKMNIWMRKTATAGSSAIAQGLSYAKNPLFSKEAIRLVDAKTYLKENNIINIDVLKMDCEHCEYKLIKKGDENILKIIRPKLILLEYHAGAEELMSILQSYNYSIKLKEKNSRVGVIIAKGNQSF